MREASEGCWHLTRKAEQNVLEESLWLETPLRFFADRPELPALECSKLECKLRLENAGWLQETLSEAAREPFEPGGTKVWYADQRGNFFLKYTQCLLLSEELFSCGVTAIHHGQKDAYYNSLLTLPDERKSEVLPFQNAKHYKGLLDARGTNTSAAPLAIADDDGARVARASRRRPLAIEAPSGVADAHVVEVLPARHSGRSSRPESASASAAPAAASQAVLRRAPPTGADRATSSRNTEAGPRTRNPASAAAEKSLRFCDVDIRYVVSPPVDQYRIFCPDPRHNDANSRCTKSMRVNQGSSEEAVVRRLKAWLVAGRSCVSKHDHVFLTQVPAEEDTGTDAELEARWKAP